MRIKDWQIQANHFDSSEPFVPAQWKVLEEGFKYQYILKDYVISEAIRDLALTPLSKVLDVGCGTGVLIDRLERSYGTKGFGIDVSAKSLARYREADQRNSRNSRADARRIPFANDSFDLAVSLDVLEHMESPGSAVREMIRVTRPGGWVVLYAISRDNRFTWIWMLTSIFEWLGIDHWSWSCHEPELLVDPARITKAINQSRCDVVYFEHFHSFFALLFDHLMQAGWVTTELLGVTRRERVFGNLLAQQLLRASSFICGKLRRVLKIIDSPWSRRGLSNGILIVAQKQHSEVVSMADTDLIAIQMDISETSSASSG